MEIKSVKKEEVGYPSINEINDKKIERSIPNKWLKLGITSILVNTLMKSKTFAATSTTMMFTNNMTPTAGAVSTHSVVYDYAKWGCGIVSLISGFTFLISLVMMPSKKLKSKKQDQNIEIGKKIKLIFAISAVVCILGIVGILIVNYLEYNI